MWTTTLYTLCLSHDIHDMLQCFVTWWVQMCGTVCVYCAITPSVCVNECILSVWVGLALIIDCVMLQSVVNACV